MTGSKLPTYNKLHSLNFGRNDVVFAWYFGFRDVCVRFTKRDDGVFCGIKEGDKPKDIYEMYGREHVYFQKKGKQDVVEYCEFQQTDVDGNPKHSLKQNVSERGIVKGPERTAILEAILRREKKLLK